MEIWLKVVIMIIIIIVTIGKQREEAKLVSCIDGAWVCTDGERKGREELSPWWEVLQQSTWFRSALTINSPNPKWHSSSWIGVHCHTVMTLSDTTWQQHHCRLKSIISDAKLCAQVQSDFPGRAEHAELSGRAQLKSHCVLKELLVGPHGPAEAPTSNVKRWSLGRVFKKKSFCIASGVSDVVICWV